MPLSGFRSTLCAIFRSAHVYATSHSNAFVACSLDDASEMEFERFPLFETSRFVASCFEEFLAAIFQPTFLLLCQMFIHRLLLCLADKNSAVWLMKKSFFDIVIKLMSRRYWVTPNDREMQFHRGKNKQELLQCCSTQIKSVRLGKQSCGAPRSRFVLKFEVNYASMLDQIAPLLHPSNPNKGNRRWLVRKQIFE